MIEKNVCPLKKTFVTLSLINHQEIHNDDHMPNAA